MGREENAELGLAYGTSPRQKVDLFFPEATGHTPLALFVRDQHSQMLKLARNHCVDALCARHRQGRADTPRL
jgi:hypothetical protein